ncbi:hypothetical protein [Burkholderia sp. Ac-20365]|uniref:hypothetical protein n=1 Tax=Burkholderia sp. Ac-20365 TaxID=2703897 RepID=UPI00197B23DC|nr:hypothetical protein [Burkholderia sp. Ac-20365]MBN3760973.1 hypothetical protein [Burkholderia sp. Ac-20365]
MSNSNSSIMSFPSRGEWGKASWRGNCSGHVYRTLFEQILVGLADPVFIDPMMGSGTSIDVCKDMNIRAHGLDLHMGFNALRDSILERTGEPGNLVLSHPPYGGQIKYSGEVWGETPHPDDLSHCVDDEDFHNKLAYCVLNQRDATVDGGYYGVIIGDWRRRGNYTSYQAELIARMPSDELAGVLIKAQHNTMSSFKKYAGKTALPFITHEYIVLFAKKARTVLDVLAITAREAHARLQGTWRNVVKLVLMKLGGSAPLQKIYEAVSAATDKVASNPNWQAKVRQTLQLHAEFARSERGVWALA